MNNRGCITISDNQSINGLMKMCFQKVLCLLFLS